jgi:hypothetical protein
MKPGEKIGGIEWLTLEQARERWPSVDDPPTVKDPDEVIQFLRLGPILPIPDQE